MADSILDNHVLVICATVALLVLVSEIGCCTVRWHRDELDVGLKHEMLARGVPPDQIVQVLQASSSKRKQMEAFNQTVQYSPRAES
ncbi:MAG TPA: hypothetical protein VGI75_02385 [Pirellulales bacterium]